MRTYINDYGLKLQEKIARYPERLKNAQDWGEAVGFKAMPIDKNDKNVYRKLKEFKDKELTNRQMVIKTAINLYEDLLSEVEADYAELWMLIAEAPNEISKERLESLQVSEVQLKLYSAEIEKQIQSLKEHLRTITQLKKKIEEAMEHRTVTMLAPVFEELQRQARTINNKGKL